MEQIKMTFFRFGNRLPSIFFTAFFSLLAFVASLVAVPVHAGVNQWTSKGPEG